MGRAAKDKIITEIEHIEKNEPNKEFGPTNVAGCADITQSTCFGYLNTMPEVFEPVKKDAENSYRKYDIKVVKKLVLFKALKGKPARLSNADAKKVFEETSTEDLWAKYKMSNGTLQSCAMEILTSDSDE